MIACPAVSLAGDAPLSNGLTAIDCQLNAAVATGYGRFFGHGGAFTVALTLVLTIYVALLALGLLTGRTRLVLPAMAPKIFAIGIVLTFATSWPAYQVLVYGLLTRGPDEIAAAFIGGGAGGATQHFVQRLDAMLDAFVSLAGSLQAQNKSTPNLQLAGYMVWASTVLLMLCTAGLLVIARVVLAVLLALGPVFVVMALFGGTRGLFEGWLKMTVAFALVPMLVVLGGAGALAVLAPLISGIADDPAAALDALRPVLLLLVGTLMYAGVLVAITWAAFGLTRGWRLPLFDGSREPAPGNAPLWRIEAWWQRHPSPAGGTAPGTAGAGGGVDHDDMRVMSVLAALSRDRRRPHPVGSPAPAAGGPQGPARRAAQLAQRLPGLGQRKSLRQAPRTATGEPRHG